MSNKIEYLDKEKVMAKLFDEAMLANQETDVPLLYKQTRRDTFQEARIVVCDMPADNKWNSFKSGQPKKGTHFNLLVKGTLHDIVAARYCMDGNIHIGDEILHPWDLESKYSYWFYIPDAPEE